MKRAHPSGFTLIELMVALAILAIMLTAIYAAFSSAITAMRESRQQDDTLQVGRLVMERIANDLAMAFYRTDAQRRKNPTHAFIGRDDERDDYARDRLDFTAAGRPLAHDDTPGSDVAELSYYIDDTYTGRTVDDPYGSGGLLVRREDPLPDDDFRHGGTLRILAENVVALNFRYKEPGPDVGLRTRVEETKDEEEEAEEEEDKWHDTWNTEKEQSLPELVEVTMTIRDREGRDHTFGTTVLLHPYQARGGAGR